MAIFAPEFKFNCTRVIYDYNYENESEIHFCCPVDDPFRGLFARFGLLDALY